MGDQLDVKALFKNKILSHDKYYKKNTEERGGGGHRRGLAHMLSFIRVGRGIQILTDTNYLTKIKKIKTN